MLHLTAVLEVTHNDMQPLNIKIYTPELLPGAAVWYLSATLGLFLKSPAWSI